MKILPQGRTASCVTGVQNARYDLYGDGVLVAVLDSGLLPVNPDHLVTGRQKTFGNRFADSLRGTRNQYFHIIVLLQYNRGIADRRRVPSNLSRSYSRTARR